MTSAQPMCHNPYCYTPVNDEQQQHDFDDHASYYTAGPYSSYENSSVDPTGYYHDQYGYGAEAFQHGGELPPDAAQQCPYLRSSGKAMFSNLLPDGQYQQGEEFNRDGNMQKTVSFADEEQHVQAQGSCPYSSYSGVRQQQQQQQQAQYNQHQQATGCPMDHTSQHQQPPATRWGPNGESVVGTPTPQQHHQPQYQHHTNYPQSQATSNFVTHQPQNNTVPMLHNMMPPPAGGAAPPSSLYHKAALFDHLQYVQFPANVRGTGSRRSPNNLRVFVGHCRLESTPAEIRWLLQTLTNIRPSKVDPCGKGCFIAHYLQKDEVQAVLAFDKKLLFDHNGVWQAQNRQQTEFLREYVDGYLSTIGKGFRLPKYSVVLQPAGGGSNNNAAAAESKKCPFLRGKPAEETLSPTTTTAEGEADGESQSN